MIEKNRNSVESVFQKAMEEQSSEPSSKVLKNIRRRLFLADFLSFNLRKFNVMYVTIILSALGVSTLLLNKKENISSVTEKKIFESEMLIQNTSQEEYEEIVLEEGELKDFDVTKSKSLIAEYSVENLKGCAPFKVRFNNKSKNAKNYNWEFGNGDKSNISNPVYVFESPGVYQVSLLVSSESGEFKEHTQTIEVFGKPVAEFEIDVSQSELNTRKIVFVNKSENANSYTWSFGDRTSSDIENPNHTYTNFGTYDVSLITSNSRGCVDTIVKENKFIAKDYALVFPLQFKPNLSTMNNGLYERAENQTTVFYPKNFGVESYKLSVRSINGKEVFRTDNIKQGWNGYIRGRVAPPGMYLYTVKGEYPNGKSFDFKGQVQLVLDTEYQNYYDH